MNKINIKTFSNEKQGGRSNFLHIASLAAHTTLKHTNLWKLSLRGYLNTDTHTRDRFDLEKDALTARTQLLEIRFC